MYISLISGETHSFVPVIWGRDGRIMFAHMWEIISGRLYTKQLSVLTFREWKCDEKFEEIFLFIRNFSVSKIVHCLNFYSEHALLGELKKLKKIILLGENKRLDLNKKMKVVHRHLKLFTYMCICMSCSPLYPFGLRTVPKK